MINMSWMQKFKPPMSDELQKRIGNFIFGDKHASKELDKNSRINGRNMMMMIDLMDVYDEYLGSSAARIIGDVLKRTSWSIEGKSRQEAVISLVQGLYFPSDKTPQGFESFGLEGKEGKQK